MSLFYFKFKFKKEVHNLIQTIKKSQPLINFYLFGKPNVHGDTLEQIWNYNDEMLETKHNYIQWLFPTIKRSKFNWRAPVLSNEDITLLVRNELMIKNLKKSLSVILRFYGFDVKGNYIFKMSDFERKSKQWMTPKNHNYKRLSRIMQCLQIFGLAVLKIELQKTLIELAETNPEKIDLHTLTIWQNI